MGLFSSPTSHMVCIERHSSRQAEWRGREWRGEGRAGQGARLLRWTFTGKDFIPLNTPVELAAT